MRIRYSMIEDLVAELLKHHKYLMRLPVDIATLVEKLGVKLIETTFDEPISGAAIIKGDQQIITVNKSEKPYRRRFTIAHELAHLLLHKDQTLTVDQHPIVLFRDDRSTRGDSWREIEANHFAANLLMPKTLVEKEISKLRSDNGITEDDIDSLAERFGVSTQAMCIRLGTLGMTVL